MSTSMLTRLFYLACELRPALPDSKLMRMLGKSWAPIIQAGAQHGLAGSVVALPGASADQLSMLFMEGAESGATPDLEEFRSALTARIFEAIQNNPNMSPIDQMDMYSRLHVWVNGRGSANGDGVMDFDAEIETPLYTATGFWPLDKICGINGVPQEVLTILAKPEAGKTTMALALACEWRRANLGPVVFIQTELSAAAMVSKIKGMSGTEQLWRSGIDQMVFGRRQADQMLQYCIDHPDPDRLILFDSVTSHCGTGDTADSRARFYDFYDLAMQAKNNSRMLIAATHVKRGVDLMDIESAAGSSSVERFSGILVGIEKDDGLRPDGRSVLRIQTVKNRWHSRVRPFNFVFDYITGKATSMDEDEVAGAVEELL